MTKATAVAHPMQGLVKYHGLKNWDLRIPYHDSISVNLEALWTKTTVEFGDFGGDSIVINKIKRSGRVLDRTLSVINQIRKLAEIDDDVKIVSENSLGFGEYKGLGFSSSAGAALAAASFKAARLDKKYGWDLRMISRIARRLAGSACRSVTGEYSRWYAGTSDKTSYAEKIATAKDLDMAIVVVPLSDEVSTETAHKDVESSAFFDARLKSAKRRVEQMQKAILAGDFEKVGELSEMDSLELHSVTMTGENKLILFRSESIMVIREVMKMREDGIPVYFSMQTGPSVFLDTLSEEADEVQQRIKRLGLKTVVSRIGKEARTIGN
jgi:diphosphomevalonate decarboxylase